MATSSMVSSLTPAPIGLDFSDIVQDDTPAVEIMIENQEIQAMYGDLCKQLALEVMQAETQQSRLTFKALMGKGLLIVDKLYLI
jgi:hypothetical protein